GECRRAPASGVQPLAVQPADERQRAVDTPPPQHVSANELVGMLECEPGFSFAITDLLSPVSADGSAVAMPHQRGGRETDPASARLPPPAHVHIVTRANVEGIDAADREQRFAAEW